MKRLLILLFPVLLYGQQQVRSTLEPATTGTIDLGSNSKHFRGANIDTIWSTFSNPPGVKPTASGYVNRVALQAALNLGGTVKIGTPGTYEIDSTLYIGDNTTLEFCSGVTLKKVQTGGTSYFTNIFINKDFSNGSVRNENIKIHGNGLTIDVNGMDNKGAGVIDFKCGEITFYKTDNIEISGIIVNDATTGYEQYLIELIDCNGGVISDIDIKSYSKDGIDIFEGCKNITIKNYKSNTGDDAIFLGQGWKPFAPNVGDCENVIIENWVQYPHTFINGGSMRIISSAWDDWINGRNYGATDAGDFCLNAGNVYRKTNTGTLAASNAPIHTSGSVTGADGITWRYISDDSIYSSNIYNVTLRNCVITQPTNFIYGYQETMIVEPTHTSLIDNLILDNCSWAPDTNENIQYTSFLSNIGGHWGTIEIKNCHINLNNHKSSIAANFFYQGQNANSDSSSTNKLVIDNCEIDASSNGYMVFSAADVTSNKLEISNSSITSQTTNPGIIGITNSNQWHDIVLTNSTFTTIERLAYFYSPFISDTMNIKMNGCNFIAPKYVFWSSTGTDGIINISGTNNRFQDVNQQVFGTLDANTNFKINLTASQGNAAIGKIYYGSPANYTFYNIDIPLGGTAPAHKTTLDSTKISNLTLGYIPYHDAYKLIDSPIHIDGTQTDFSGNIYMYKTNASMWLHASNVNGVSYVIFPNNDYSKSATIAMYDQFNQFNIGGNTGVSTVFQSGGYTALSLGTTATPTVTVYGTLSAPGINIGTGTEISKIVSASLVYNCGSIAAGVDSTFSITCTGAVAGNPTSVGVSVAAEAGLIITAECTTNDVVTVRISNHFLVSAVDPASRTFKVMVTNF